MEKIISRVRPQDPEAALRQFNEFTDTLKVLPFCEVEQAIADKRFRKQILFNGWAIRPFWKDGREAPPLPWEDNNGKIIKGHKASSRIVRGH